MIQTKKGEISSFYLCLTDVQDHKVSPGTPGTVSFEQLLGWLDQLRVVLEDDQPIE